MGEGGNPSNGGMILKWGGGVLFADYVAIWVNVKQYLSCIAAVRLQLTETIAEELLKALQNFVEKLHGNRL